MTDYNHRPTFVFDFGRVLVDWDPRYLYRKLIPDDPQEIEDFLREVHFYEWTHLQDSGGVFSEHVDEWCRRYPHRCELLRAYDVRYPETILGPIPGTVAILRQLIDAGYATYGLSNWPEEKFRLLRHKFEFFDWLDGMVISGEVKLAKPDPAIFNLLLGQIGRPAQDCLLIDDSRANVETARQMGFQTVLFESPEQLARALDKWVQPVILTE